METLGVGEEKINSAEISEQDLSAAAAAFTTDFRGAKKDAGFYQSEQKIDWKVLQLGLTEAKSAALASCQNEKLKDCLATAYGLLTVMTNQEWIDEYRRRLAKAETPEQKKEIHTKLHQMPLNLAEWQHKCISMIKELEDIAGGEEFIASVWTQMSDIGSRRRVDGGVSDREVRKIKNGVLGLRAVIDSFEYVCAGSEVEIILPKPEEDVEEKIDLLAIKDKKSCAIQIKSHHQDGIGEIGCKAISGFQSTVGLDLEQRKVVEDQNKFWEKINQRRKKGDNISALWVDVDGQPTDKINQTTGKPALEYLEEQDSGGFGADVRQGLGIRRNTLGEVAHFRQAA